MKKIFLLAFLPFFFACQEKESTLKSIFGQELSLFKSEEGYKIQNSSKLLIFDIFSLSCSLCKEEAKELTKFQLAHKDEVQILALAYEKNASKESLENFAKAYNAYYFINLGDNSKLIKEILKKIAYKESLAFPLKIIFKDGKFQSYILGKSKKEDLEELLEKN